MLNHLRPSWGPSGTIRNHPQLSWITLIYSNHAENFAEPCQTILDHPEPSWTFWNHPKSSWTILNHLEPSWTILNHPKPSWTVLNHPEPSPTMLNHPKPWAIFSVQSQSRRFQVGRGRRRWGVGIMVGGGAVWWGSQYGGRGGRVVWGGPDHRSWVLWVHLTWPGQQRRIERLKLLILWIKFLVRFFYRQSSIKPDQFLCFVTYFRY